MLTLIESGSLNLLNVSDIALATHNKLGKIWCVIAQVAIKM